MRKDTLKEPGFIHHGGNAVRPEASQGLTAVDVEGLDSNLRFNRDPRMVDWAFVESWRPTPKLEDGLMDFTAKPTQDLGAKAPSVQDTLNERGKTHGDFTIQANTSQRLKTLIAGSKLRPYQQEALETICMKMSRILNGNPDEPDHWRDIAGYATLVENILVHGKSHLG